jgi:hypothetical protein
MNDDDELMRLERDLAAVAGRLERRIGWSEVEPRVRWAMRRPARQLAGTISLIAVCVGAGLWAPATWLVAAGLLLAVLPDRIRAARERRLALADAGEGDLLALYGRELQRKLAGHFVQALAAFALALLFLVAGVLAPDSRPGLIAAALLATVAAVRILWLFPRAYRDLCDFEGSEVAG